MHARVAGFGFQVPFGDIPSDVHTAVIYCQLEQTLCYTSEDYLSTTQCAWDSHNGAITRSNRHPTVDRKKFNHKEKLKRGSGRSAWKQYHNLYVHGLHFSIICEGRLQILWLVLVVRTFSQNQSIKPNIVQVYLMWVFVSELSEKSLRAQIFIIYF